MHIRDFFLILYGPSQFKHTIHADSDYTHVYWDMKCISLWASNKIISIFFLSNETLGHTWLGCFYLFVCFIGVHQRIMSYIVAVCSSQTWAEGSWRTENMRPKRGQSQTEHQGNWDQWAWTGKRSFALTFWFHVAFHEASTTQSIATSSVHGWTSTVLTRQAVSTLPLVVQHCKNRPTCKISYHI